MILSFSVPEMRPMIEAGLRQMRGEPGDVRVKRQTIRARGPIAERLLAWDPVGQTIPYDLSLWWKSRTAERAKLGDVPRAAVRVSPIEIWHTTVQDPGAPPRQILRIDGSRGWRAGDAMLFWSSRNRGAAFEAEVKADGFDTVAAFRDYFVPNPGDRFDGILYRW
ncbi:hypothetical protein [Rhodoplanes roseus]|uniref:Uncharacterized protein n=1 Tax=Rhodoplanes roseus TaxID=29409 RepID=A0A327KZZ5_9BRAD|nr:hypothetical protein [Rhodoplanes roseus]RAI42812.1 hypothetical protein CH341_17620 [Rhodoplanes roseus]